MPQVPIKTPSASLYKDRLFWLSLVCGGFFLSFTLWYGLGQDQAICSYAAWVWQHFGKVPYVGVWDHNFPGIFLVHRLALVLFGTSTPGFRLFDFLVTLSDLAMIFYLAKRLSGSGAAGFLAAVLYSIYYLGLGDRYTAQREAYVLWFLLIALVVAFASEKMVVARALLVGLLAGLAFLVKPTYGLSWPVFGLLFLAQGLRTRRTRVLIELLVFSFACFLPALLFIWYYRHLGQFNDLFAATVWFNFDVFDKTYRPNIFGRLSTFYLIFSEDPLNAFSGFLAILVMLQSYKDARDKKLWWTILALVVAAIISILMQGKDLPYHRTPFWGFFLVFSGAGWAWMGRQLTREGRQSLAALSALVLYAVVVMLTLANTHFAVLKFAARHAYRDPQKAYLSDQTSNFNDYKSVEYLRPRLKPGDEITLYGWHPLIPLLLEKKLPSRFCDIQFLFLHPEGGSISERQRGWMREYSEAVLKAHTRFFIISDFMINSNPRQSLKDMLPGYFPDLQDYLKRNYKLVKTIGAIEIYELNSPAS